MSPSSPAGSSSSSLPFSNTLLALPDGAIPASHADRTSPTVSTIGGYPTFPFDTDASALAPACGACTRPIPLLAQVYCPPEDGENDRTVYVFACGRAGCQRKQGAVRAWRASRRNEEYVRDVDNKRKEKEDEEKKLAAERRQNPFTISDDAGSTSTLFGSANLFGSSSTFGAAPSQKGTATETPDIASLSLDSSAVAKNVSLKPPHPAYLPPQYLTTVEEYLPPPEDMDIDDGDSGDEEAAAEKAALRDERWEQLLPQGQDLLFERFVKRIADAEGGESQVLRYELGGIPLPYSSTSAVTSALFPGLAAACKAQKPEDDDPSLSSFFTASKVPPCPRCRGERVSELQLLPSLINILVPDSLSTSGWEGKRKSAKQSEDERKRELERLAKGSADQTASGANADEMAGGMEWGTVVVFGCKADCVGIGEEWVGVEWEAVLGEKSS